MNAQERLRQLIGEQQSRLEAGIPANRPAAIQALLRELDRLPHMFDTEPRTDLVTGGRMVNPGGNLSLRLCLESAGDEATRAPVLPGNELAGWAKRFLQECGELAEAGLVLAHCATGFMRMVDDGSDTYEAWISTKRTPASWRERADIEWWALSLARHHQSQMRTLKTGRPGPEVDDLGAQYRQIANLHVKMMAYQLGYPSSADIGGCSVQTYCDVLEWLIGWALQVRDSGQMAEQSERSLVAAIASDLVVDPAVVSLAVSVLTLDPTNATYHGTVPGVAAAPLVRIAPDRILCSGYGLTTEPLFFLTRELRRRDAQEYHNVAFLREDVFRQDLYNIFDDKRFVTSTARINLRRASGGVRTDIDAVVFDRKTGTLGVFELKSQDPFARSTAALERQRDNVLYANRQISGMLDWLKRHGADEVLSRVDTRTAKTFHVQKVYPFVLGRYLASFSDGPEPDRRAAWGTWPQLLRLLGDQPARMIGANPLATLFSRLSNDASLTGPPADDPSRDIAIGPVRLIVHPSYAAFKTNSGSAGTSR